VLLQLVGVGVGRRRGCRGGGVVRVEGERVGRQGRLVAAVVAAVVADVEDAAIDGRECIGGGECAFVDNVGIVLFHLLLFLLLHGVIIVAHHATLFLLGGCHRVTAAAAKADGSIRGTTCHHHGRNVGRRCSTRHGIGTSTAHPSRTLPSTAGRRTLRSRAHGGGYLGRTGRTVVITTRRGRHSSTPNTTRGSVRRTRRSLTLKILVEQFFIRRGNLILGTCHAFSRRIAGRLLMMMIGRSASGSPG